MEKRKRRVQFTSGWDQEKKEPTREGGWFHEWVQETEMENDYEGKTHAITRPFAIIEDNTGKVHLIHPTQITFR